MCEKAEIQIFENDEFGTVRVKPLNGEPYFVGKDVARILGYAKPLNALSAHVDEEDTLKQGVIDAMGRLQETILINESGFYTLVLSSKMPNAKRFKRWVTTEVLPTIRKNGMYFLNGEPTEPQRLFTTEDYLSAARIVANCRADRLPYILSLLSSGGWELNPLTNKKLPAVDTSDIAERIKNTISATGCTIRDISAEAGIDYNVMRSYYYGNRFPKAERYNLIVSALERLNKSAEEQAYE